MRTVRLTNSFHDTAITLRVPDKRDYLTARQVHRARRELCGRRDCQCGHGPALTRGPDQTLDGTRITLVPDSDGSAWIETC
ncbi:MAG: hypothetical protein PHU85_02305 [Phycisphaerae bacterium]|nr:hypothetical protein [Phycisphaerae bacterium]